MRQLFEHRHGAQVEGVPCLGLVGSNAPLTEYDSSVAFSRNVFGGKQKLLDGSAQAALEHDRFVEFADVREQLKVLHVARPDLQNICILTHNIQVPGIKHFGDDRQASNFTSMSQMI